MAEELELERTQLECIKVAAARHELEFQIKQRQAEIRRIQAQVDKQLAKEAELAIRIKQLGENT